ncbi:MAG: SPOR domain-containing protein [Bacteroidota bacterium]
MNRDDLLRKCVERGVADEGSIEAVSHLLYVYLLSALQKGQRVEIPQFGTFGTRVAGLKRTRRVPFFEPDLELAQKVNERYGRLRSLVIGTYELKAAPGDREYEGREPPYEHPPVSGGRELVLDTARDVTIEEYERSLAEMQASTQPKEKHAMPKLNLKGGGPEEEGTPPAARPPDRTPAVGAEEERRRGPSALVQGLIALGLLALVTAGLNYFDVIRLWGDGSPTVTAPLPEPEPAPPPSGGTMQPPSSPPGESSAATGIKQAGPPRESPVKETPPRAAEVTPPAAPAPAGGATPEAAARQRPPAAPSGLPGSTVGGRFTVQVSSWTTAAKANREVARLAAAGLDAYVTEGLVLGRTWHRVRIGRYATEQEASRAASLLLELLENGAFVAEASSR